MFVGLTIHGGRSSGLPSLAKRVAFAVLPLSVRKRLAVLVGRQRWLKGRYWYSMELVRDLAARDPSAFHRFLWANHIGYAETYEVAKRFGDDNVHPSRRLLFDDLVAFLRGRGIDPTSDVRSVFEVGCSMGYLLRYMETSLFPAATVLEGVDSRVELRRADMADLSGVLGGRGFDIILCAGVLMYLPAADAAAVVRTLLEHAHLLVLTGPAFPEADNRLLDGSERRPGDQTFIHNLDAMVTAAGRRVLRRRWEGPRSIDGNTIYFVFAEGAWALSRREQGES
jgi:hypothetical protein